MLSARAFDPPPVLRAAVLLLSVAALAAACGSSGGKAGDDEALERFLPGAPYEAVDPFNPQLEDGLKTDAGMPAPASASASLALFASPSMDVTVGAGTPVVIQYRDTGPAPSAAKTSVYADRDGDLATTADQVLIAADRPALPEQLQELVWQTREVPAGNYRLVARVLDSNLTPADSTAAGVVTVEKNLSFTSPAPDEVLRFDLALVTGTVLGNVSKVTVMRGNDTREWPVVAGRFKALVPLVSGTNDVRVSVSGVSYALPLQFKAQTNLRRVRLVYLLSSDGDGTFEAPAGEPNSLASAVARLRLSGRLMQTFMAEKLATEGFGRRTFALLMDAQNEPVVHVFRSALTTAELRAMDDSALWSHFYGELGGLPDRNNTIDVAVLSMTQWDPVTKDASAHTALGGGRLGLFGSGTLHTYAASLDEVVARFNDMRVMDANLLMDDSAGRGTFAANYATGLGATLHELGHTLSLPHPANRYGVMSRDFDYINRAFMMVEPPNARSPGLNPIQPTDERGWDRSAAVRLRFHRYLAMDALQYGSNQAPSISFNGASLVLTSSTGLRDIRFDVNGEVVSHEEFLSAPAANFVLSLNTLRTRFPGATELRVSSIDNQGNIGELTFALP